MEGVKGHTMAIEFTASHFVLHNLSGDYIISVITEWINRTTRRLIHARKLFMAQYVASDTCADIVGWCLYVRSGSVGEQPIVVSL